MTFAQSFDSFYTFKCHSLIKFCFSFSDLTNPTSACEPPTQCIKSEQNPPLSPPTSAPALSSEFIKKEEEEGKEGKEEEEKGIEEKEEEERVTKEDEQHAAQQTT
ncbi:hypothetical protein, partial [Enterococcus cecorum]|uniref:hypothetical protein n=1 Tax=Enterococcus cecorum TaxID=44008 RepID=UPI001FAC5C7E